MDGIPPSLDTDSEDVAWAIQTADALWKRGELVDAIVWLRRAAQAAGETEDDDRALALARNAAELSEWLARTHGLDARANAESPEVGIDSVDAGASSPVDDLLGAEDPAPDSAVTQATDVRAASEAGGPLRAEVTHAGLLDPWAGQSPAEEEEDDAPTMSLKAVSGRVSPSGRPTTRDSLPNLGDDDEVVTTARHFVSAGDLSGDVTKPRIVQPDLLAAAKPQDPPVASAPPPVAPARPPTAAPPPARRPTAAPPTERGARGAPSMSPASAGASASAAGAAPSTAPRKPPPVPARKPPPLPPRARGASPSQMAPAGPPPDAVRAAPSVPSSSASMPAAPPSSAAAYEAEESSIEIAGVTLDAIPRHSERDGPPASLAPLMEPEPERTGSPAVMEEPVSTDTAPPQRDAPATDDFVPTDAPPQLVDLSTVAAFSDLPDDAREAFARAATSRRIAPGEQVAGFALALLVEGNAHVAATTVDVAAHRLEPGAVLRARGTAGGTIPLRIVPADDAGAVVAFWDDESVDSAFETCPWVEDELRQAADRVLAHVGLTTSPFPERLPPEQLEDVTRRLEVRSLPKGEVVVSGGDAVPGLFIVGLGQLELYDGSQVTAALGPGEFLFPSAILGGDKAPCGARAGDEGALVLFASRSAAQEMLVTFPTLLELFAGM